MHPAVKEKRDNLNKILHVIEQAGEANIVALKDEFYNKLGLTPSLVQKYLKELRDLGKIEFVIDNFQYPAETVRSTKSIVKEDVASTPL